jgi:chromosome segregation ATPase
MRNPFRKTPMQQLETTIASLTNRGEQLTAKRVTAQDALDKAIKTRQQALLSGDLDDQRVLDKVQAIVSTATSALAGIDDALAVLIRQKAEAERQLAAESERIKRAAAADKLSQQIAAIEAALPGYLEKSRALADALSEIGHFHFESGQMAGFLQNTMGQIEVAANFTLPELIAMTNAIREGRQAIPGAPAPVQAVTEPTPEMQTASQGVIGKSVPHIEPDPVLRAANFTVIDRNAEARTIPIAVPRT